MLQPILNLIKSDLLTKNPKTFVKGYAGARQYDDGKIVIYDNFEGEFVGLQDTKNNYFYIRYRGKIDLDATDSESRSSSCYELTGTAPLRLVAWVYNADVSKLTQVLLNDVLSVDFDNLATADKKKFSDINLFFEGLELDPEQIFKEETGKEEIELVKNVVLVALDLGVQFNYKQLSDDCIDRNICDVC